MFRKAAIAPIVPLFLALSGPVGALEILRTVEKPMNFIFFVPDELRADALGSYGGQARTPNLDRLAAEGIRFDQTFTSNPGDAQSRVAFMTGWPTHAYAHQTNQTLLPADYPNMLKYLKNAGYQVKWWGKNDLLAPDAFRESVSSATSYVGNVRKGRCLYCKEEDPGFYSMLYDGFKLGKINAKCTKKEAKRYGVEAQCSAKLRESNENAEWLEDASVTVPAEAKDTDADNVNAAINFLESQTENSAPFAIFLPLTMPRPPYSAPEPWHSMFHTPDIKTLKTWKGKGKPEFHDLMREHHLFTGMEDVPYEQMLRKVRAVYYGMTSYVDELFGRLIQAVDNSKVYKHTAVFVWSDHGDYAGDYGLVGNWPSGMEDALTRVPLLARVPGFTNHNMDHLWSEPTQLYDVMATVLELANIQPKHLHFSKSLTKQLRGTATASDARKYVFAEGGFASFEPQELEQNCDAPGKACAPLGKEHLPRLRLQFNRPDSVARAIMIRSKTAKLVWRSDPKYLEKDSELYDLNRDPEELVNLWGKSEHKDLQKKMLDELLQWLASTSELNNPQWGSYINHQKDL